MKRRLLTAFAAILLLTSMMLQTAYAALPVVEVYKDPNCGCCTGWIKHLQDNGFTTNVHNVADTASYRKKFGIPATLGSCHTATVGGYAIEGHVPAADIKRLLKEHPTAIGLAVPGMPLGSPGMEAAKKMPYDVLLLKKSEQKTTSSQDVSQSVFHHYDAD
ncbi:DUF411 domain-containing protein [Glaciimonas soli]|uniref:DUF411 domain-containing protein n=1 Tax=Glaciimonas soli TaxID=2590999 RepID=A0A843YM07_9BURK|nr:DUF411 domain-containing protein [Glaciimonas soli]MQQ99939.1 DUF411 domain-containing protein [Glaciimonas soli]